MNENPASHHVLAPPDLSGRIDEPAPGGPAPAGSPVDPEAFRKRWLIVTGFRIARIYAQARVTIGDRDEYDPDTMTVRLTTETANSRDVTSVARALHESAHAEQHRRADWLWTVRRDERLILWGWRALVMLSGFLAILHSPFAWAGAIVSLVFAFARLWMIDASERQASDIATQWMINFYGLTPEQAGQVTKYLASLRISYWWMLIR